MRKLYQVKMITNTMSSEHYHPLFIVRADNEEEVYARLPLIGLTTEITHNWEVSEIPGEKVSLAKLPKKARTAVKRKGYPLPKKPIVDPTPCGDCGRVVSKDALVLLYGGLICPRCQRSDDYK